MPRPGRENTAGRSSLRLSVRVAPHASHHQLIRNGNVLRVRLAAAPVDGEANRALVELLAASLDLPKRDVNLTSGFTGRDKTIEIQGLHGLDELWQRLGL